MAVCWLSARNRSSLPSSLSETDLSVKRRRIRFPEWLRLVVERSRATLPQSDQGRVADHLLSWHCPGLRHMRWPAYLFHDITSFAPGESHRINSG